MDTENIISLKVDRILKHKYHTDLAESGTLDDDEFRKIWRLRNKTGEIVGNCMNIKNVLNYVGVRWN